MIRGARRFNEYQGYSQSFKFAGNYEGRHETDKSLIIAVDALDYTKGLLNKQAQYNKKFVKR